VRDASGEVTCRLLVIKNPEDLHESGDVEDLLDLRVAADEIHGAAVFAHALEATDQHAETRRIDVADVFEIDDQAVVFLVDQFRDRLFDLGRRVDVDLAVEIDDRRPRFSVWFSDTDFDIHSARHP
jgi:hypothetical protein